MKLEDLPEIKELPFAYDINDVYQQHQGHRIKALEARLKYAKELLTTSPPKEGAMYIKYFEARTAFIAKLNQEGL